MTTIRSVMLALAVFLAGPLDRSAMAGPSVLFDVQTGEVLSHERAGEPWYPASLTKLMTAYVVFGALKTHQLELEQNITVSELASSQPASKIGVKAGGTISVDFALQALLVYSANDMAYVLAEAVAPSVEEFAHKMNAAARQLGMTGTHYVNPNGLFAPRQITTARDIAILAAALVREYPEYNHYFSQDSLKVGKKTLANRNSLIRRMPEADGMKTGFVCNSGFNLVATATRDNRKLGAVVFGANSGKHRADLAEMLLVDGFARPATDQLKLQELKNLKTGAIVPADMTATVCKQKTPVTITSSKTLSGWGISFGNYESAKNADMALRGRLLSSTGMDLPGKPGIIRMPGAGGYAAVMWNLDEQNSLAACADYHVQKAPCEVLTPDTFAQITALTPEPEKEPSVATQGSDGKKKKSKKPRKKKKK